MSRILINPNGSKISNWIKFNPVIGLFQTRSHHFNHKSRVSPIASSVNCLSLSNVNPNLFKVSGLRFASTGVAGQPSLGAIDVSAAIPSTSADKIDLSRFLITNDSPPVTIDSVPSISEPGFDLAQQVLNYVPTAAQIEITWWLPTGKFLESRKSG